MRLIQFPIVTALVIFPLSFACAHTLMPHTITIMGTSTIRVPPDTAVVELNLTSTGQTAEAAVQADKGVLAALLRPCVHST
jgi:uncharacterized protein YggE